MRRRLKRLASRDTVLVYKVVAIAPIIGVMRNDDANFYAKRHDKIKTPRESRISIPRRAVAPVKLLFSEMRRQNITYPELCDRSGVLPATIKSWRTCKHPNFATLAAAFQAIGWTFVPIPNDRVLPTALQAELAEIATRHDVELEDAVENLVAIVTGIFDGLPAEQSWAA